MTNFERIKNMSSEQLGIFLQNTSYCSKCVHSKGTDEDDNIVCGIEDLTSTSCMDGCIIWLNSEVD